MGIIFCGPRGCMNTWLFFLIDGHRVLVGLEVCDFDKAWSACQ